MSEQKSTFLCGGVLFFMLMKATYPDGSARDHREGIKDEHKAPDVMSDLIYTFTGSRSFGSEKDTSNYRECKIEGTVNVPFNDESIISAYESTIKNRYTEALGMMREFCLWHINSAMKEWLVRALLEIIEFDEDIKDTDRFYVLGDGSCMNKSDMKKIGDYELEPFLVGVLYFILRNRCEKNYLGTDTLDYYGNKKKYKERIHKGNAGKRIERTITVTMYDSLDDENTDEIQDSEIDEDSDPDTDNESAEDEYEEADIDEEEDCDDTVSGQDKDEKKTTLIQHQINVIQEGENNFNLTNNGVMNFDFGGGRK